MSVREPGNRGCLGEPEPAAKTLRDLYTESVKILKEAGVEGAGRDAMELICRDTGLGRESFILNAGKTGVSAIDPASVSKFLADIEKRASRVPLQHILGECWFYGLKFKISEDALIPRTDTEILAETVLTSEKNQNIRLLDLCCGSGCLAVALKKHGRFKRVEASDIDEAALRLAEENARALLSGEEGPGITEAGAGEPRMEISVTEAAPVPRMADSVTEAAPQWADSVPQEPVKFIRSDLFDNITGLFDVIVSNPPYVRTGEIDGLEPEVRDHDPRRALDGGRDGLDFYRRIAADAPGHMKPGGRIYLEIGYDEAADVERLLAGNKFVDIKVIKDLSGSDRVVAARLSPEG